MCAWMCPCVCVCSRNEKRLDKRTNCGHWQQLGCERILFTIKGQYSILNGEWWGYFLPLFIHVSDMHSQHSQCRLPVSLSNQWRCRCRFQFLIWRISGKYRKHTFDISFSFSIELTVYVSEYPFFVSKFVVFFCYGFRFHAFWKYWCWCRWWLWWWYSSICETDKFSLCTVCSMDKINALHTIDRLRVTKAADTTICPMPRRKNEK